MMDTPTTMTATPPTITTAYQLQDDAASNNTSNNSYNDGDTSYHESRSGHQ